MKPFVRMIKPLLATVSLLALVSCQTVQTTQGGVVGVDRAQNMIVPEAELQAAAQQQYSALLARAAQKGVLNRNPTQVARVKAIANRLIPQTAVFRPDARA